jgi:hypothetical protein
MNGWCAREPRTTFRKNRTKWLIVKRCKEDGVAHWREVGSFFGMKIAEMKGVYSACSQF